MTPAPLAAVIAWTALMMGVPVPDGEPRVYVMDRAVLRAVIAPDDPQLPHHGAYIPWRQTIAVACGAPAWVWPHEVAHWLQHLYGIDPGTQAAEIQARELHARWVAAHPEPDPRLAKLTKC